MPRMTTILQALYRSTCVSPHTSKELEEFYCPHALADRIYLRVKKLEFSSMVLPTSSLYHNTISVW